jgi:nucleoside-diphosphate-sugar epimerase
MRFLVTGTTGFVGKALTKRLISEGHEVVGISRRKDTLPTRHISCSLEEIESLEEFLPIDGIFHTAAKVGMWGDRKEFYKTNVEGTKNLLELAAKYGIRRFVYTSSPSVIASGEDIENVDERVAYPEHYLAFYPETKALAEKMVLRERRFYTLALRPHLIFGPGDTNLIPTILAKGAKLKRIGSKECLVDFTYIDDCVNAHILAMTALSENPKSRGRAYFISQGEPYPLWRFVEKVLESKGLSLSNHIVDPKLAYFLATIAEFVSRLIGKEPMLTRFLVEEMSTHHYFDISAAKKELLYNPTVSIEEGLRLAL